MNANPMRVMTKFAGLIVFALADIWTGASHLVEAAEPARGRVEFDSIDVAADQPAAWPKEVNRMIPVPRQEFISLMKQLNSRSLAPRPVWLKSAHYEATLVNETLQGGLMTASVQRLESRPAMLDLGPFSFALDQLKWQDRPAIWGSSSDGRAWLLVDGNHDELLGEWSCRGRAFPGGIDFDLQLPPATISFLDVRVPKKFLVFAPTAEVTPLTENSTEETRLWRIQCSNDSRCRVTFVAREGVEESRRSLLVEHDMHVVVREDDVRFQLNLYLEALDAPIQELTLKTPAGLVIYSAVFGVDTPVPIQRSSEAEADGRLLIRLPGPLSNRKRTLRIDGIAVQKPGQPTIVPQLVVENSTFDGGHLAVTVQSPLQVRSIRPNGYRQRTTDGERLTFQQLTPDSQLILDVHRAQVSLSGQILSVLEVDEDSWNLTSEIVWVSQSGNAYQSSCLFAPEWEVTDVSIAGDAEDAIAAGPLEESQRSKDTSKLNWDFQQQPGGRSILTIEFLESIQPGQLRAVKVRSRRRPPQQLGQLEPMPIPQLLNCDASDVIFAIQVPNSVTPVVSADSRLERVARPTSTMFTLPADQSGNDRQWYRGDSADGAGTLQLKPRLQPIHVKMETIIEALPTEYRLKYSIQNEQRESGDDRILVYLTESSPDVRWTLKGPQPLDLSATRLSKSQHVEWSLPSKGELWEIRLPRGISQGVTIEGVANNRWSSTNRPALLFVPQAVEKLSELKLTQVDTLEVTVDTDGMKPTGQRRSWWYATPQVAIDLALRNPEPSREFPAMVSMQLRTLMSAETGGFDLYRARLQLENGSAQESLRIKLDSSAVVQEAFVGGESIVATFQGGEFVIPGLNATRRDTVEIIYRVPARSNLLFERRRIVVPHVSAQVLGFFWEFGIPSSARMFSEPSGIRLSRSLPSPTWNERLLGPLGRTGSESIFNPLRFEAWRELFQPRMTFSPSFDVSDGELVAPVEWQVHQAVVPDEPTELWVELWDASRTQMLTWIIFGFCLSLGILLRMLGWSHRDLLAGYWLGICCAAACAVSAPFAGFVGGAIAGTLIALLVPRQLLRTVDLADEASTERRQSAHRIVIASLVGGLTIFSAWAFLGGRTLAQETVADESGTNSRPVVYVPVDKHGQPSETFPLVYVPREALARWKAMAGEQASRPNYLVSSARYEIHTLAEGNLSILAQYRVHLLPSTEAVVGVSLPLSEVSLPDADSCRVNGKPHAISALANGKGYLIELARDPNAESDGPVESTEQGGGLDKVVTFDIELRSRKTRPLTPGFDLHIPPVASSHIALSFLEPTPFAEIAGGRGSSLRDAQSRSVSSELGAVSVIQAHWGAAPPVNRPARLTASMLQYLELRPDYAELNFHLTATIDEGGVDAIEFDLPPNAVVRKGQLRADDLLRSDVIVTKQGQRRLRLIFDKARQSTFKVDGALVLLQSSPLVQTPLPQFVLAATDWLQIHYERNWWGVSASTDFRIESTNLEPENVNMIAPDAYLSAWVEAADPRHPESIVPSPPQLTFEKPNGATPALSLILNQPRRRAIQWRQTGFIGKRRLEWTLVGEIETTQAATFQTVLLVDRRLRIEKLSVMENDAERRVRRTETRTDPSRVVLFLSDKSQGRQIITLRGSMPITPGAPIVLPSIRPEDCEVADARLILTRDSDVDVTFTPPREWKQLAVDEPILLEGLSVLGAFQITDPTVRATIQSSARHSRCSCRAAALMRRIDGGGWQLKYRLEMIPEGDSPLRIGLTFPATFADLNSVTVERAEPAWHDVHDGIRQLDLLLNRSERPGNVVVQFETTLAEPRHPDWQLPLPIPLSSNNYETLLVIEPESIWFPTGALDARVADLPEWSTGFYSEFPGNDLAFRITKLSVELQRDVVTSELRDPSIRLLDQRIWRHAGGRRSGITQAFLSSIRNDLEFDIPPRVQITSIFLDDHPLALVIPSEGRLKIPMTDAGTESLLTITWIVDETGTDQTPEPFLWPREIRIERNLVGILPDDPTRLWCRSGLREMGSLDQGLDRLQTLLDRHAALGDETRGALANRWLLDQLQARLAARLPKEVQHPTEEVANRLRRWTQLIGAINQLEPVPVAPPLSWHARLLEGPVTDSPAAIRGSATVDGKIRFWQFDRRVVQVTCTILLALILIPLFRRTVRIEWSLWLHRHTIVSWSLLAAVWWLFLTPSALGPVLFMVGLLRTYAHYNSARPAT